jgi:hypothetical protein
MLIKTVLITIIVFALHVKQCPALRYNFGIQKKYIKRTSKYSRVSINISYVRIQLLIPWCSGDQISFSID